MNLAVILYVEKLYTWDAMLDFPSGKNIAIATNYQQLFQLQLQQNFSLKITGATAIATFVS